MKILHTSDWHLGKKILNLDRLEEQKAVMDEIVGIAIAENVDAVIVSGDLFDTINPSNEAMILLNKTLSRLSDNGRRAVIALAGNHDSPDRVESPSCFAQICGVLFYGHFNTQISDIELDNGFKILQSDNGFIELLLPNTQTPLRLIATPFVSEFRLRQFLGKQQHEKEAALRQVVTEIWQGLANKYCNNKGVNILATHLFFMENENDNRKEELDEEHPINIGGTSAVYASNVPSQMQYVALGHLHRYQAVSKTPCPVVYSGSPIAYSFAEDNQDKYVLIVNAEAGEEVGIKPIKLTQGKRLLRKTADTIHEALTFLQENQEQIVELTLKTKEYISGSDKALLKATHKMLEIIPFVENEATENQEIMHIGELKNDINALFIEHFKKENKGTQPSNEIMDLFKEILQK